MSAKATLAAVAALSVCALAVGADRAREQGLLGSLLTPETRIYAPVDYTPPKLPPLKAKPASLEVQVARAPAPAAAPAPIQAAAVELPPLQSFAAAPDLAASDDLVALAPPLAAPEGPARFDAPQLARMNVLDGAGRAARREAREPEIHASRASRSNAPCGNACEGPSIAGSAYHAAIGQASPNIDLRWSKLPCSRPGAYRYEVANRGRHRYTGVALYDGDQRWDVGTLDPGQSLVISSAQPLGPRPAVEHDPLFVSVWDP